MTEDEGATIRTRLHGEELVSDKFYPYYAEAEKVYEKLKERAEEYETLSLIVGPPEAVDIRSTGSL
jgi:hypothetical protein